MTLTWEFVPDPSKIHQLDLDWLWSLVPVDLPPATLTSSIHTISQHQVTVERLDLALPPLEYTDQLTLSSPVCTMEAVH